MNTNRRPLRPGWHTAILPADTRDPAAAWTGMANDELDRLQQEAWSAGFTMEVTSVTVSGTPPEQAGRNGLYIIILYRLKDDPSFHPPM